MFVYKILIKEARKVEIELDFVTHCAGANDMHAGTWTILLIEKCVYHKVGK